MQTFLPYPDFKQSAKVLDYRRLGKQRVEVLQLLKALQSHNAWSNHPAAKMWKKYERALCEYGMTICKEWISRGYNDTCFDKMVEIYDKLDHSYFSESNSKCPLSSWLGNKDFHVVHRSNLLRKDLVHYS